MVLHLRIALISVLFAYSFPIFAQSLPGSDIPTAPSAGAPSGAGELEELYDKDEAKPTQTAPPPATADKQQQQKAEVSKVPEAKSLSDLARLAPFSDVAVIQRRFLPKTGRFEASASVFTSLNNPFYSAYGVSLDLSYYLRERWAIEGIANFSTTSARQVTNDLSSKENITTSNLVTANGFYGGAIKWNPVYGKITWLNKSIVPFDFNFSAGGGVTTTNNGQDVPTLHLGTSQVFAWTKSVALRWDVTWNLYQATAADTNGNKTTVAQNDLYLGFGLSFYFPEASYR